MKVSKAALRSVPFLSVLSDRELDLVVESSRQLSYPKGSIVFHEGDSADHLLVVLSGRVKIVLLGEAGQEIILAILEPYSHLGELALLESPSGMGETPRL